MNQSRFQSSRICSLLVIVTLCTMSTGCSTISPMSGRPLPVEEAPLNADAVCGTYSVEMYSNFGSPKQYKGELTGTTTVTDALEAANAVKRHRSLDVEILRVVEANGKRRGLRMPVNYETRLGGPSPEQDYALLDGDRIVVRPKQASAIVKMVSNVLGGSK